MKQLFQRLDTGETVVERVPAPRARGPLLVVDTKASVISAGTERMLVDFGRSSLLTKARRHPERVRQVLDKVRTDGVLATVDAVRSKLGNPIPLGYCNAGVVLEAGPLVRGFGAGDRVVTNGPHAERISVSHTQAARIPDRVSFEDAAFTPLAAVGLQGMRLAEPAIGETAVVYGLGLIGLLTVQLLRANGCRVLAIDIDEQRLSIAESFGATPIPGRDDVAERVLAQTSGQGADLVLLTLTSSSHDPIRQAAAMSRKRGRVVLVGVTGLNLPRDEFFKKELSFAVSCSYGPGRYDAAYEEGGHDYPLGYVRWTQQRNFEAVLDLMDAGRLNPAPLVTHRFNLDNAAAAYDVITGGEPSLGILLRYPDGETGNTPTADRVINLSPAIRADGRHCVGVIGAGNFAVRTLLPALKKSPVRLHTIVSRAGASAAIAGKSLGFENCASDIDEVLARPEIDSIFVLTRHDSHAQLAVQALRAGKHVFVEKPLALNEEDLQAVVAAAEETGRLLTVGFNRRFAPFTAEVQRALARRAHPMSLVITVNAGAVPPDHWTHDPAQGGGRIVGEASHFIDLARALVGSPIRDLAVATARDARGARVDDISHIALRFDDGSTAVVNYLANGSPAYPKERVECFCDGKTVVIDNWRRLRGYGITLKGGRPWSAPDKGHRREIEAWLEGLRLNRPPIPVEELHEVALWSIRAARLAHNQTL